MRHIWIGDDTVIGEYCELSVDPLSADMDGVILQIGSGCRINQFNRLGATCHVEIQDNVLLATHVFVSDTDHSYEDVTIPIWKQPWVYRGPVVLESGCWLGDGVKVIGGVTIGRNSVIGANAVVIESIPPYSVAVGIPARVVKRFDSETREWLRVIKGG